MDGTLTTDSKVFGRSLVLEIRVRHVMLEILLEDLRHRHAIMDVELVEELVRVDLVLLDPCWVDLDMIVLIQNLAGRLCETWKQWIQRRYALDWIGRDCFGHLFHRA